MIHAIVFSNNSPALLELFLESAKSKKVQIFDFSILYRSDKTTESDYLNLFKKNNISSFHEEVSFKDDLLNLINKSTNNLVSFFKDTNYFFSELPNGNIEQIMNDENIFCFSLGLGRNVKHDFLNDVYNILLNEEEVDDNIIKWNWVNHYLSFGRPLELGQGHTFHKKEIFKLFKKWSYSDILSLEESFEKLDYYPKEYMTSFTNSVITDIIRQELDVDLKSKLQEYDFKSIDRNVIEI